MARRKSDTEETTESPSPQSRRKRARDHEDAEETEPDTPSKRKRTSARAPSFQGDLYDVPEEDDSVTVSEPPPVTETPKRKRGRPPKNTSTTTSTVSAVSAAAVPGRTANGNVSNSAETIASTTASTTASVVETPKRKRGRPPKNKDVPTPAANLTATPSKLQQPRFETPSKATGPNAFTPRKRAAVDRSAKRKSARALIERAVRDDVSDDENEDGLVREIYESSDDDDDDENEDEDQNEGDVAEAQTPSKTPSRRGRKPKARSPTPPRDLPPHELYFLHNKPGRPRTSNNTLASLDLLTHEEYFSLLRTHRDHHEDDLTFLQSLHEASFPQWSFELSQGFSLCLYGQGSKRALLTRFAEHIHASSIHHRDRDRDRHKLVIVNGYVRSLALRDLLITIAAAIDPDPESASTATTDPDAATATAATTATAIPPSSAVKLPAQPHALLHALTARLTATRTTLTLLVNSMDAPPLRRPAIQHALAHLASHPSVRLVCTVDTPDFPLLWDAARRAAFNFLFHDATTLRPLDVELDPVDDVHDLLGRRARAVNGKVGVVFVLRSLPENAKSLFRLLVTEVLLAMDDDGGGGDGGNASSSSSAHLRGSDAENPGVEYRMLYNKAVEEFICSSEMAFRTLLKEFHDHQIITSKKDAIGTELLSVPLRREELEAILEELMT
ncbi:ORC2-domain-containing protein [Sodiomyces alkalinus F11]|uniref:Origin recognition complex subunit 2 n=1 Tax=Sodiomyces alkalinus (strain CBS 110278 / VKM F-3762 / F11) TaxID=1314773 RepID=A0A3N2PY55_SODAK|nr:ORC2-domain-containing protein [Sodiomyces alkalinus F11]ROT39275.1 ORC2-domain-containing protein [Sodiomyces alkalinus F11]